MKFQKLKGALMDVQEEKEEELVKEKKREENKKLRDK